MSKLLQWVLKALVKESKQMQQMCVLSVILLSQELPTADFVKILNCPAF